MNICRKRITKEFTRFLEEPNKYESIEFITTTNTEIILRIHKHNKNVIEFRFNDGYPFKNPMVYLNDNNYRETLVMRCKNVQYYYNNPDAFFVSDDVSSTTVKCICCSTLTCSANWGPANDIHHVLTEIETTNQLKRNIFLKIILNRVIDKTRLPQDIIPKLFHYLMVYNI